MFLVPVALVMLLSGCFTNHWIISVKPDGSGTITMDFSMDQSVMGMMQGMAGDGGEAPPMTSQDMIDPDTMASMATAMGEGVRFVSADPLNPASGAVGYTALFEFDDISKVKINPMLGAPSGDEQDSSDDEIVSFKLDKGFRKRLTIFMDQSDEESDSDEADYEDAEEQDPAEAAAMAGMMKPFLEGMGFSVKVQIDGRINKTDATYVDGNTVTLMDFDMGKILNDDELFGQVIASNSITDEEIREQLEAAGIRVEPSESVYIDF